MSEWQSYLLGQIGNEVSEIRSDVRSIKQRIEELTTWLQRLGLLAALWTAGIASNFAPETVGKYIAAALKSIK